MGFGSWGRRTLFPKTRRKFKLLFELVGIHQLLEATNNINADVRYAVRGLCLCLFCVCAIHVTNLMEHGDIKANRIKHRQRGVVALAERVAVRRVGRQDEEVAAGRGVDGE